MLGDHWPDEWRLMKSMANQQCCRCNQVVYEIVKDHVVPLKLGGSNAITNCQPLCTSCNAKKGNDSTDYFAERRAEYAERLSREMPWVAELNRE